MQKDVKQFYIEESKVNKGQMMLIVVDENDQKYVVGGDATHATFIQPYEQCWNTKEPAEASKFMQRTGRLNDPL